MRLAEGLGRLPALQPPPLHRRAKAASMKQVDLKKTQKNKQKNPPPQTTRNLSWCRHF